MLLLGAHTSFSGGYHKALIKGRELGLSEHGTDIHKKPDTCHIFAAGYDIRTCSTYRSTINLETLRRCAAVQT